MTRALQVLQVNTNVGVTYKRVRMRVRVSQ